MIVLLPSSRAHAGYGAALAMAIVLFFGLILSLTNDWLFLIDHANLGIHEIGHVLWRLFGETLSVLGGTLTQVLVPLACGILFFFQRKIVSSMFCLWWTGQNLVNSSIYIADANRQALPLVGGENVVHDWFWLLSTWTARHNAALISSTVKLIGVVLMVTAIVVCLILAYRSYRKNKTPKEPIDL